MKYLCIHPNVYDDGTTTVYLEVSQTYSETDLPDEAERGRLLETGRLLEVAEPPQPPLEQPKTKKGGEK